MIRDKICAEHAMQDSVIQMMDNLAGQDHLHTFFIINGLTRIHFIFSGETQNFYQGREALKPLAQLFISITYFMYFTHTNETKGKMFKTFKLEKLVLPLSFFCNAKFSSKAREHRTNIHFDMKL